MPNMMTVNDGDDRITVWRVDDHPYPWRFSINYGGSIFFFVGVPNYCGTRKQALQRSRARLRSLRKGGVSLTAFAYPA